MIIWIISRHPFPSRSGNPACVWSSRTGNKLLTLWLLLAMIFQTSAFELKARPLRCIKAHTLALTVELPFRTKRLQKSCRGSLVSGSCSRDTLANLTLKWAANEDALHSLLYKGTLQASNCHWSFRQLDWLALALMWTEMPRGNCLFRTTPLKFTQEVTVFVPPEFKAYEIATSLLLWTWSKDHRNKGGRAS